MHGCEDELEAARSPPGKPVAGLFGDVRGVIVQDQLDRRMGRIGRINELEKLDGLTAAVLR